MALPFLGFSPLQLRTKPSLTFSWVAAPPPSSPNSATAAFPAVPFHVFPSGAQKWFFSASTLHCAGAGTVTLEPEQQSGGESRTRLIAMNIPWTYTADDVRALFEKHGVVDDVELSMYSSKRNRGLAFITMGSEQEASDALNSLNSQELDGRVIRVDYSKSLKKKPPVVATPSTKHNVFVGNLTYSVRSKDLRELIRSFNPNVLSTEIIYQTNPRRPAGYGFASFASKEEAESAVAALTGKKLMGRSIRLILKESDDAKGQLSEVNDSSDEKTSSDNENNVD